MILGSAVSNVITATTDDSLTGSSLSDVISAKTAPPRPTELIEDSSTATTIDVAFTDNTSGEHWHRIYSRIFESGDDWTVKAELAPGVTSASLGGFEAGTYEFVATAFEGSAESGFDGILEVTFVSEESADVTLNTNKITLRAYDIIPSETGYYDFGAVANDEVLEDHGWEKSSGPSAPSFVIVEDAAAPLGKLARMTVVQNGAAYYLEGKEGKNTEVTMVCKLPVTQEFTEMRALIKQGPIGDLDAVGIFTPNWAPETSLAVYATKHRNFAQTSVGQQEFSGVGDSNIVVRARSYNGVTSVWFWVWGDIPPSEPQIEFDTEDPQDYLTSFGFRFTNTVVEEYSAEVSWFGWATGGATAPLPEMPINVVLQDTARVETTAHEVHVTSVRVAFVETATVESPAYPVEAVPSATDILLETSKVECNTFEVTAIIAPFVAQVDTSVVNVVSHNVTTSVTEKSVTLNTAKLNVRGGSIVPSGASSSSTVDSALISLRSFNVLIGGLARNVVLDPARVSASANEVTLVPVSIEATVDKAAVTISADNVSAVSEVSQVTLSTAVVSVKAFAVDVTTATSTVTLNTARMEIVAGVVAGIAQSAQIATDSSLVVLRAHDVSIHISADVDTARVVIRGHEVSGNAVATNAEVTTAHTTIIASGVIATTQSTNVGLETARITVVSHGILVAAPSEVTLDSGRLTVHANSVDTTVSSVAVTLSTASTEVTSNVVSAVGQEAFAQSEKASVVVTGKAVSGSPEAAQAVVDTAVVGVTSSPVTTAVGTDTISDSARITVKANIVQGIGSEYNAVTTVARITVKTNPVAITVQPRLVNSGTAKLHIKGNSVIAPRFPTLQGLIKVELRNVPITVRLVTEKHTTVELIL